MHSRVMKEGKSKVLQYGNKIYIYVPFAVAIDSSFLFKKGDRVALKIVNNKLIVEKDIAH